MRSSRQGRTKRYLLVACLALAWLSACGRKPYDHPVPDGSQQPDKVLFDKAIDDLERGRYERARLTLQTLMNTYPDSEYVTEAERALEETWRREGKLPETVQ